MKMVMISAAKNYDFGGSIGQCVSFKMALESHQSEICGESYGHFTESVQDGFKTDMLVF